MMSIKTDSPTTIRQGEGLELNKLNAYLISQGTEIGQIIEVAQFPNGYSNLTYFLKTANKEYVLRRPPFGAKDIKGGHDMSREFRVLTSLKSANFKQVPTPIICCEEDDVIGCPFYIMERVEGVILRAKDALKMLDSPSAEMLNLSEALCDNLVKLHAIDIVETNLITIGKPEGYIQRQVEGWHKRYQHSQTDDIKAMDDLATWLKNNMPKDGKPTLLHNDYKYDNLVLNAVNWSEIVAILDWEMATVGDPLMDLGTALSYWSQANDSDFEKSFNLTWLIGNLTRQEFAERYAQKSGRDISKLLYFYVFGLFKNAVILQQIYSRFQKGLTKDQRFAELIHGVKIFSKKGVKSIDDDKI